MSIYRHTRAPPSPWPPCPSPLEHKPALDRPQPSLIRPDLQVAGGDTMRPNFRHFGFKFRPPRAVVGQVPSQKMLPRPSLVHPYGLIGRKSCRSVLPLPNFPKLHFGPQSLDFLILAHFIKPLNFPYCIQDPHVPKHRLDPRRFRKHLVSASL